MTLSGIPRWQRMMVLALLLGMAVVAVMLLREASPYAGGFYPPCPILALTGWWCPGCGMLRATYELSHGNLAAATARNPLAIPVYLITTALFMALVRLAWTGRGWTWEPPRWLGVAVVVVMVAFMVARNLPGWTWLSPA